MLDINYLVDNIFNFVDVIFCTVFRIVNVFVDQKLQNTYQLYFLNINYIDI